MKFAYSVLVFALFLTIASCTKKDDGPTVDLATVKVKIVSHSQSGLSETYSYDGEGRVLQIQSSAGSKTTYVYIGDTLTISSLDNSGTLISTELMLLNGGLAQSSVVLDAGSSIIAFHEYSFSGSGEETLHRVLNANMEQTAKEEWMWSYGSVTQYSIYDTSTSAIYNTYYWYNYPGASSTGKINTGKKYLGADPVYQVRKILQTGSVGNTYRSIEYTTDDQKRVTAAMYYNQNHELENTDSYTYY